MKFPNDVDAQRAVAAASNGMAAKRAAYALRYHSSLRSDWDEVRVGAMRIALCMKLDQHYYAFSSVLLETGRLQIVENAGGTPFGERSLSEAVIGE